MRRDIETMACSILSQERDITAVVGSVGNVEASIGEFSITREVVVDGHGVVLEVEEVQSELSSVVLALPPLEDGHEVRAGTWLEA